MNTVYLATLPNGKIYIGITNDFEERKRKHLRDARSGRGGMLFHRALKAHGFQVEWQVLHEGLSRAEACAIERQEIAQRRSQDHDIGYNVAEGGDGRQGPLTEEHREKIRKSTKAKTIIAAKMDGTIVGTWPSQTQAAKALSVSQGAIANCILPGGSRSAKGYLFAHDEQGIREAAERAQTKIPRQPWTEEQKAAASRKRLSGDRDGMSRGKPFHAARIHGEYLGKFQSKAVFGEQHGINPVHICMCLSGRNKSAGGLVFGDTEEEARSKADTYVDRGRQRAATTATTTAN